MGFLKREQGENNEKLEEIGSNFNFFVFDADDDEYMCRRNHR